MSTRQAPHSSDACQAFPRRGLLAGCVVGLLLASAEGQAPGERFTPGTGRQSDEPIHFEERVGFVPTPLDTPPIAIRRVGESADALVAPALGPIEGRIVADIGAGRGKHVYELSKRVGAAGHLFVTEISKEGCDALAAVAAQCELANVTVRLGAKTDVGLEPSSIEVALLSDVYPYVLRRDDQSGQDKHAFLTSLREALVPGGEVVVTYVTSDQLKQEEARRALLERTLADFSAYGFEAGRRWVMEDPLWPRLAIEFRLPKDGPASASEHMGRTIATTMHWKAAGWLSRSEREEEEASTEMLRALGVQPGWTVTDFGCGNGYYTLQLAREVGPQGRVFAVDIQPEMLELLKEASAGAGVTNVVGILGGALDAPLPHGSSDLVLLADVYHEMSHPVPMLAVIRRALKPEGRLALLEFRAEDPKVPIKPLHKMSRRQILAELEAAGFRLDGALETLPRQHLLFFKADEGD